MLERLSQVTCPPDCSRRSAPDFSPVGQIYWYTLHSTNPNYDLMDLKSLEDWTLEKQFKSVPNVVDVVSFGGTTREYQVRIDPDKLVSYGLNIGQVEQQLAEQQRQCRRQFCRGRAAADQRARRRAGPQRSAISSNTVVKTQNGTPIRIRDIGTVEQGPKIRLGQIGKAIHREDGKVVDNDDVVEGIVLLRKGADSDSTLDAIHEKVKELNERILPPGVKIVPHPRSQRSAALHHPHGAAQPHRGHPAGGADPVHVPGQRPRRVDRCADHSVLAAVRFHLPDLNHIPANLLSLGALDFGMVVEGAVVMVENIVRYLGRSDSHVEAGGTLQPIRDAAHEVQRPVFYSIGIIITAYLPIFTLQRVEGRLFKPMAWTVSFALLGSLLFSMLIAPVLSSFVFRVAR